jgi:iron(III) transport system ATP-binding protein
MAHLELEGIVQRYGSHTVVDGVSLRVETGGIACLLGPSGCGKTTLLRCIAGFEAIAAGEIRVQGRTVSRRGSRLPPGATADRHGLSGLRALSAPDGGGQRRFWSGRSGGQQRKEPRRDLLATVGLMARATSIRMNSPGASSSVWRWPAPWRRVRS